MEKKSRSSPDYIWRIEIRWWWQRGCFLCLWLDWAHFSFQRTSQLASWHFRLDLTLLELLSYSLIGYFATDEVIFCTRYFSEIVQTFRNVERDVWRAMFWLFDISSFVHTREISNELTFSLLQRKGLRDGFGGSLLSVILWPSQAVLGKELRISQKYDHLEA